MANVEKIKIVKIGRKQQPSKFKPGETYSITTIMDEKNRKLVAMGAWGEKWQVGDVIEASVEEKKWTDKDGFEQISLNLKNPNQSAFTPRGGSYFNPVVVSYQLAASLAPLFFSGKKKVTLANVDELAAELKKRIEVKQTPAPAAVPEKKEVPTVDVDKEETTEEEEDDDERPF
ncbi:MAG: hypothetical protein WC346_03200 [Methanogenium sp.]|jgi:hypothetical protein